MKPLDLIRYIVWYATQVGNKLTTNRLVKFTYLADLYQARCQNGKTITGFPWRFIYYGPYCSEVGQQIEAAVKSGYICKDTFDSKYDLDKDYNLFWCKGDKEIEEIEELIDVSVIGQLQSAIKKYGDDTPKLLDHIYFETEPMESARKGDLLNFSKARAPIMGKPIKLKKLSPESIKRAREKIKRLSYEFSKNRRRLVEEERSLEKYKDDVYFRFVKLLDGEELETGLKGISKIQVPE